MNPKITVAIQLAEGAQRPTRATDGSAGYDFYPKKGTTTALIAGQTLTVDTGVAMEIPKGHALLILSRSGHGFKKDARLANCVGLIDSDYRGEIKVKLRSDAQKKEDFVKYGLYSDNDVLINDQTAIAQGVFIACAEVDFITAESLQATARGTNGFGSTDKDKPNSGVEHGNLI